MELLVGLLTITLVALVLRLMGIDKGDVGCLTIFIILFALPLISKVGKFVLDLF